MVKVKMVIFILGFGHLFTIYKYKIFIIVEDFDTSKTILTKMTMTIVTAERLGQSKKNEFFFELLFFVLLFESFVLELIFFCSCSLKYSINLLYICFVFIVFFSAIN